ncbi:MAG: type I-PGING CRISPR-associated protein Cas8c/Csp2 [Chitinophagaceae bacterium]|nr:type I-PGING CRISPR-associated protein Cas8c/Csp2 [Chitinophagaceae bacterium]
MSTIHPYLRYAKALIFLENDISEIKEITAEYLISEIEDGLQTFRVQPKSSFVEKDNVLFRFVKEEKGNTDNGVFLAPNIISPFRQEGKAWNNALKLLSNLSHNSLDSTEDITMSAASIAGEYLSFSANNASKRTAKGTLIDVSLGTIATLTSKKPCLQYRIDKKGKPEMFNVCLIPDLEIEELKDFISLFKRMLISKSDNDLMVGNVIKEEKGKGNSKKVSYFPKRPLLYRGNFPNPPRSSALGAVSLLGAIGEFAKEAIYSEQAKRVLESLKRAEIYMIKYGNAKVFSFNHHIIDLAKESKLKIIIDSLYYSKLYNQDKRTSTNTEYQKYDLFTSRFLQLFNHSAFKDFLAFRAEYPAVVTQLFTIYFTKMEKIDLEIVKSARILGKWLNKVAYFAAKNEVKEGTPNYWEDLRKAKAKVLVELESSTFSAKSGDALLAQVITRGGRLSRMDAPEGAALFMEKTASGELPIDASKNLLIAFSRLMNKSEKSEMKNAGVEIETEEEEDLSEE